LALSIDLSTKEQRMSAITVIGGNGYTGAAVVAEALGRGHAVTVVSRSTPADPVEGVTYIEGSALDVATLDAAFEGADAVVMSVAVRDGSPQVAKDLAGLLADKSAATGVPIFVVGGFSSLRPAPGEPRVAEGEIPEQYRAEALAGHASLEVLLASPEAVDWVFFSPAAHYGSWVEGSPSGRYRLGGEVMILDEETGTSYLYAEDLADAILDVIESDDHHREHLSVVS
jgi:putative NADH-flavin reductase